jgi:hypothetical protein
MPALVMSTETPKLQNPKRSGGLTWIRATSRPMRRLAKYLGDLGEVDGNVVDFAFEGRFSHAPADKKQFKGKAPEKIGGIVHILGKGPCESIW